MKVAMAPAASSLTIWMISPEFSFECVNTQTPWGVSRRASTEVDGMVVEDIMQNAANCGLRACINNAITTLSMRLLSSLPSIFLRKSLVLELRSTNYRCIHARHMCSLALHLQPRSKSCFSVAMLIRPAVRSGSVAQRVMGRGIHNFRERGIPIDIHPEVEEALQHSKPVVALETALVSHGLPFPQRLEVPLAMEQNVRSTGAVPATIGLISGRVKVGLERHELERLADPAGKPVKISRRDIAPAIATGRDGGER